VNARKRSHTMLVQQTHYIYILNEKKGELDEYP
jgi:hypothetical protein